MSFGTDPPPSNPPSNPYSSASHAGHLPPDQSGKFTQLVVAGSFILGMAVLTLGLALLGGVMNLLDVNPNAAPRPNMPEAERIGFIAGQIGGTVVMLLFQGVAIAGGISMIRRKNHTIAVTGACVALIPLCGPCFGLSIPFGIWALVLLLQPEVKSAFR